MKKLKMILIVSLSILLTLIFKIPENTSKTVQAAPTENSDKEYTVEYHDIFNESLYWQEDFLKDCMTEGSYQYTYNPCGLYSQCMIVREMGDDFMVLENCNGFTYVVNDNPEDAYIGDIYTAIMYDNRTIEVMDDVVVTYKYDRPDLLLE